MFDIVVTDVDDEVAKFDSISCNTVVANFPAKNKKTFVEKA